MKQSTNHGISHAADEVEQNVVFTFPTISRLAGHILDLANGSTKASIGSPTQQALHDVTMLIERYAPKANHASSPAPLSKSVSSPPPSNTHVVLVTGTTGALGAHLLASLISDPSVARVWALNRAHKDGDSLYDRQRISLTSKSLDVSLMSSPKLYLLEVDLAAEKLGLDDPTYSQVCSSGFTLQTNTNTMILCVSQDP